MRLAFLGVLFGGPPGRVEIAFCLASSGKLDNHGAFYGDNPLDTEAGYRAGCSE